MIYTQSLYEVLVSVLPTVDGSRHTTKQIGALTRTETKAMQSMFM